MKIVMIWYLVLAPWFATVQRPLVFEKLSECIAMKDDIIEAFPASASYLKDALLCQRDA